MSQISVIIPHYNDVQRLTRCLEALMPQVRADVDVIVADNGSSESLDVVVARWPTVRVVVQPEKGAGPARNAGAWASDAPWLLFLDADCVPADHWLETARDLMDRDVVYGGAVTLFDETPPPKSGAEAFETIFAFQVELYLEKGFLASCQLVMAREAFERVGGFKSDVSEDVDWSRRATGAGLRLALSPELSVSHPSRSDWTALERKWRRLTSEEYLTEVHGPVRRLRWALKAVAMPLSVLMHLPRVLLAPALTGGERIRAVGTLIRLRFMRMIWMLKQVFSDAS